MTIPPKSDAVRTGVSESAHVQPRQQQNDDITMPIQSMAPEKADQGFRIKCWGMASKGKPSDEVSDFLAPNLLKFCQPVLLVSVPTTPKQRTPFRAIQTN